MTNIGDTVTELRGEQAREAVKNFRSLLPSLNSYVRALTGNKAARIEVSTKMNGGTDGKTIFMRPPMALGVRAEHNRALCDKRDALLEPRCPACRSREHILVTIYHEIAHISFGSFSPVSSQDKADYISRATKEFGTKYSKQIAERLAAMPERQRDSYVVLASMISPFLQMIVNSLEDARVNARMFEARRGTRVMFEAFNRRTFTEGVEQKDGSVTQWRDYPLNMQIIIGLYCKASQYDYGTFFDAKILEDLKDEVLNDLIEDVTKQISPGPIYNLSFKVLARLREMGYCKSERDPEDEEPEDEPAPDETPEPSPEPESEPESDLEPESDPDSEPESEPDEPEADEAAGGDEGPSESDSEPGGGEEEEPAGNEGEGDDSVEAGESDDDSAEPGPSSAPGGDGDEADSEGDGEGEVDGEAPGDSGAEEDPGSGEADPEGDEGSGSPAEDQSGDGGDDESDGVGSDSDASSEEMGDGDQPGDGDGPDDTGEDEPSSGGAGSDTGTPDEESDSVPGQDGEASPDDADLADEADESAEPSDGGSPGSSGSGEGGVPDEAPDDADNSGALIDDGPDAGAEPGDEDLSGEGDEPAGDQDANEGRRDDGDYSPHSEAQPTSDDGADGTPEGSDDSAEPDDGGSEDDYEPIESTPDTGPIRSDYGEADDIESDINRLLGHDPDTGEVHRDEDETDADKEALRVAIVQGEYFESPSRVVTGVREHTRKVSASPRAGIAVGWARPKEWEATQYRVMRGVDGDFDPPESIMGPALMRMRVTFSENKRAKNTYHLKAGKVNARTLGKRAWGDDERLFKTKQRPGKRSYVVILGVDISGSTTGTNLILEKQVVMAQAELLHRMGIPFAIIAHSANYGSEGYKGGIYMDMYHVKDFNEVWNEQTRDNLRELGPDAANLDGHSMEYYRKMLDRRTETDKILMYHTDGKMPAENADEELVILQRELRIFQQKRYTCLGVGINTDSPREHGLDTVEVNETADVVKVIRHLEKRLENA